jgi:large subunit ribosomal protein L19e
MKMKTLRRIAAETLKVGTNRVRIKINDATKESIGGAMTRADVAGLAEEGTIYAIPVKGRPKKEKRKGRGEGKRKGTLNARMPFKELWMRRIRSLRKYLGALVSGGYVDRKNKRKLYLKMKGGYFRGKSAFLAYLKDNGFLLKEAKGVK